MSNTTTETIEISKKSLVILALSQPGGSERSNPDLAKEVGCDAKFVRSVRAEIEYEKLFDHLAQLHFEITRLEEACHCQDTSGEPAEVSTDRLFRRVAELQGKEEENVNLKERVSELEGLLADAVRATQEPAVVTPAESSPVARVPRKRKPHVEHYPLFETV